MRGTNMSTQWILPEVLPQVGTTKDLNTPLFGLKFHKDHIYGVYMVTSVKKDHVNLTHLLAERKEGDWYYFQLEAGYYNLLIYGEIDRQYFRLTSKGFLIPIDLIEIYEDNQVKSNTLSPYIGALA
jgi:hypothetical protein